MMFRPLKAEEIEVRVSRCNQYGVDLLLYKTARTDANLLDECAGPENWQNRYHSIDGKLFCDIGIRCGEEWVWKSDTGTESNMEAQKGEASDAMKRAGFKWGIGRELYTAPHIFVDRSLLKKHYEKNGRWACYDDFRVTDLAVDEGRITRLEVCNASDRMQVVYGSKPKPSEAKKRLWAALNRYAELSGKGAQELLDELKSTEGWQDADEYYTSKAELFEAMCDGTA